VDADFVESKVAHGFYAAGAQGLILVGMGYDAAEFTGCILGPELEIGYGHDLAVFGAAQQQKPLACPRLGLMVCDSVCDGLQTKGPGQGIDIA